MSALWDKLIIWELLWNKLEKDLVSRQHLSILGFTIINSHQDKNKG
jgi:hypothetical protein